jgi:hypothetical protein
MFEAKVEAEEFGRSQSGADAEDQDRSAVRSFAELLRDRVNRRPVLEDLDLGNFRLRVRNERDYVRLIHSQSIAALSIGIAPARSAAYGP